MRFVFAIVAFVVAAGMITLGIAQRTVLAPEPRVASEIQTQTDAAYTVIDGPVLNTYTGQQRLVASGSDTVFAAYARTTDVDAWLGSEPFNRIGYDAETGELTSTLVEAAPADGTDASGSATDGGTAAVTGPPPAPSGSDLWLEETSAESTLRWTVNVPDDISIILASDGTAPAPADITVSWPVVYSTPWAGPLVIGGGILLLVGLGLYIWGLIHMRRTRGPRRKNQPKMPKVPQPPRIKAPRGRALEPTTTAKGRRSVRRTFAALALVGAGTLVLSGCATDEVSEYFGDAPAPTPSASASAQVDAEITPVAVTQSQVERIVSTVSAVATEADESRNADLLKTRFTGPALQVREANYAIRGADGSVPAPDAIPASPLSLDLPEATETWPRRVLAVVGDGADTTPPTVLVLVQQTPRDNYMVTYAMRLQADTEFPAVAPPTVGAPVVAPDNRLLSIQPDLLGPEFADLLLKGQESEFYSVFAEKPDGLRTQVGVDYKNAKKAAFPSTATIEFSNAPGTGPVIAFASNESGAIVATDIIDRETARPVEEGATIDPTGQVKALSGITSTEKGVESSYGYQLLFYVPPSTDETSQVVLLGYAQGLISVREL
ncbi:hypothetical protein ACFSBZ_15640 [Amnibacterium flavum]|uniref:DUF8094 domain-containing protein n=1 Tax=Amnibacterium flavum TaxID=2173173 RepID=A0A2V1HXS0_9MICO|nr:hypothetical protein [Amnibacterium flavum]PVZ96140.1 hypothetical protein DDQ50_06830 [Amnibacterium flavum]